MVTVMRTVVHVLLFAAAGFAFFAGLGMSLVGTAVWGEVLWIVAGVLVIINLVWIVRRLKQH